MRRFMRKCALVTVVVVLFTTVGAEKSYAVQWLSNQVYDLYYDMVLPDSYTNGGRYPVLYLLHGREQSYLTWREKSVLLTEMNKPDREFIVVLPEGEKSWYQSAAWVKYIRTDLPTHIEQTYRATKVRGIGGLSMGGYGSFHISGQSDSVYVKDYKSVSSMSGAFVEPDIPEVLGDGVTVDSRSDLAAMVGPKSFPIYMDCGAQDKFKGWIASYSLKEKNESMRDKLYGYGRVLNSNLYFYLPPGEHNWSYWNSRIPYHLDFHAGVFAEYPVVAITSFPENVTSVVTDDTLRLAGTAHVDDGIASVTWKVKSSGKTTTGAAYGTTNWHFDIAVKTGKNKVWVTATSSNGVSSWARIELFRRNSTFRVRKVIVKPTKIVAKTSDITYGDTASLTNGPGGDGFLKIGNCIFPITNMYWTHPGKYVAKYKDKTTDYKYLIKVNGKAQKDFCLIKFKWLKSASTETNFQSVITSGSSIPLHVQFGLYGDGTNVVLNSNWKYKWDGKWFE